MSQASGKINMAATEAQDNISKSSRKAEWLTFLFVTLVVFPGLAVAFVGGYGLLVWVLQLINGPPVVG